MKTVLHVAISLVIGAGGGYLVAQRSSPFEKKKECSVLGNRYMAAVKKDMDNPPHVVVLTGGTAYNQELDTCVCDYTRVELTGRTTHTVADALTGRPLATLYGENFAEDPVEFEEFRKEFRSLMEIKDEDENAK